MLDCFCYFDMPKFYNAKRHKARKRYVCYECGGPILPGTIYENAFGMWDDRPDTYRTCDLCLSVRDYIAISLPCYCVVHGEMLGEASEMLRQACIDVPEETRGVWFGYLRREYKRRKELRKRKEDDARVLAG